MGLRGNGGSDIILNRTYPFVEGLGNLEKRITIYDIAEKLGISTATVNRALTGKPRVKEETRALVLKTAAELGFKPNALARSLARRQLRLAVIGFTSFEEFHGPFLAGARNAGEELKDFNVSVDYFSYDDGATNTPESDEFLESTLRRIAEEGYDGVLALARHTDTFQLLRDKGIYVATAVNDINEGMRNFYICYNGVVAGRMAAELIYHWMHDRSRPVAIASGFEGMGIHDQMVTGFRQQIGLTPLKLCTICYNFDNEEIAYENTLRLLEEQPELGAIYVNSYNSSGVIRAVRERGMAGKLLLITSDINDELRERIADGTVSASIFQNQYEQGRLGLHKLYNALANGEETDGSVIIDPQIVLASNLCLF